MFRFGETKVAKKKFYGALKVNVDNKVNSKLIETKNDLEYLIGHLDKVIRPLVLV